MFLVIDFFLFLFPVGYRSPAACVNDEHATETSWEADCAINLSMLLCVYRRTLKSKTYCHRTIKINEFLWLSLHYNELLKSSFIEAFDCFYGYRTSERSAKDVEVILNFLRQWRCLDSFSNAFLRRLASAAYLEDLDDGVTRNYSLEPVLDIDR